QGFHHDSIHGTCRQTQLGTATASDGPRRVRCSGRYPMSGVPAIVIRAAAWNALPLLSLPFGVYVIMSESIPSLLFLVALGVLTMLGQAMFFSRMLRLRRR